MPEHVADKSVNLILADLPFGVTQHKHDKIIPFPELWQNYGRIIKDNAAILLFAQGTFYVDLVNSNRKMFRYDLVWDKQLSTGHLNANRMPLRIHEQVAVFYKKQPVYNPQFTKGRPIHSKGKSYKQKLHVNNNYGKFEPLESDGRTEKHPTSILSFQKPHSSSALHRTAKPIELLEYLILTYSNEGDVVLDNTMGSGGTGVAAVNWNRSFIGIEEDTHIFNKAKKLIENAKIKPKIFYS